MKAYRFAVMRILHFWFDGNMRENIHGPHNLGWNCVV